MIISKLQCNHIPVYICTDSRACIFLYTKFSGTTRSSFSVVVYFFTPNFLGSIPIYIYRQSSLYIFIHQIFRESLILCVPQDPPFLLSYIFLHKIFRERRIFLYNQETSSPPRLGGFSWSSYIFVQPRIFIVTTKVRWWIGNYTHTAQYDCTHMYPHYNIDSWELCVTFKFNLVYKNIQARLSVQIYTGI